MELRVQEHKRKLGEVAAAQPSTMRAGGGHAKRLQTRTHLHQVLRQDSRRQAEKAALGVSPTVILEAPKLECPQEIRIIYLSKARHMQTEQDKTFWEHKVDKRG